MISRISSNPFTVASCQSVSCLVSTSNLNYEQLITGCLRGEIVASLSPIIGDNKLINYLPV
ncbi:unknown protein [Microcystis aeruginosa NIES-843]|uniref:Uncharacterized protein n=1 Tax=Microcystis aeruginosa (strain NIES-843 / IAM M-2473) TaxID=449447 RepID=B0JI11_MICAN|nr:unknown protein [Microcystis aeruginosa NIES-843]